MEILRFDLRHKYRRAISLDAWKIKTGTLICETLVACQSVAECQAAYEELSLQVFGKEQPGKYRYDVRVLERNIETVLANKGATKDTSRGPIVARRL
jgi:hypothetical protein